MMLKPVFSLGIGSFQASSLNAVGGPTRLCVERDMAVAADALELDLMDRSGIRLGDAVTVALGHDDELKTAFTGEVAEIRPALRGVRVRALGKMDALLNLRVAAVYEGRSAGSIVRDLIGQAGLSAGTVDDGPTLPRYALDRRLSAYRHLRLLAERLGYELYTDRDGKVMFHGLGDAAGLDAAGPLGAAAGAVAPALGGASEGYAFGKHLIAASARHRTSGPTKIEVGGESPMSSQGDTTSYWLTRSDDDNHGESGDGDRVELILDPAARTKDLADRYAAGYLNARKRLARQVRATVLGRPGLDLGDWVTLSGVPDALVNGSGYVQALRHRFGGEAGFLTDVRVVLEEAA